MHRPEITAVGLVNLHAYARPNVNYEVSRLLGQISLALTQRDTLHPRAAQALRDQYESQIEELREELADYEALRHGEVIALTLNSLTELPEALIRARTAAQLSQADLAARLGLKKQQVQRYEATRYAGVSLQRIQDVANALGLTIREQVEFPTRSDEHGADAGEIASA